MTEVILKSGMTVEAADVIKTLISSEVSNTIANNTGEFNLALKSGIKDAAEAITYYLQLVTGVAVNEADVYRELEQQLS